MHRKGEIQLDELLAMGLELEPEQVEAFQEKEDVAHLFMTPFRLPEPEEVYGEIDGNWVMQGFDDVQAIWVPAYIGSMGELTAQHWEDFSEYREEFLEQVERLPHLVGYLETVADAAIYDGDADAWGSREPIAVRPWAAWPMTLNQLHRLDDALFEGWAGSGLGETYRWFQLENWLSFHVQQARYEISAIRNAKSLTEEQLRRHHMELEAEKEEIAGFRQMREELELLLPFDEATGKPIVTPDQLVFDLDDELLSIWERLRESVRRNTKILEDLMGPEMSQLEREITPWL